MASWWSEVSRRQGTERALLVTGSKQPGTADGYACLAGQTLDGRSARHCPQSAGLQQSVCS